jgi:hypothetical protein
MRPAPESCAPLAKGHRFKLSGDEWDAFHKRSRNILRWKRGAMAQIKRRFWKRARRTPVEVD